MKIYVSWLALWMLIYAVNAESTNFADTSIPDITTPVAVMASLRPCGGDGTSGDSADALGGAFHQVAQGLQRMQESLRLQQHQAKRRAQEALLLQQHRAETALRDAERHMEQKFRDRDEAIRTLREECSSSIQRMETKMKTMEERFVPSARREDGGHVSITQLESRMDTLEAKLKEAFEQLFPNMEALIEHLKRFSSSGSPSAVPFNPTAPSNITSTVTSSSASSSTSPSPLPSPSPYTTSPTSVSSPNSTSTTSPSPSSSDSPSPSFTTPNSTSPTAYPSSPSFSQSPSSSFTTPTSTSSSSPITASSSTSARPPAACDEECEKQRVQLRVREVKKRARAAPSRLGEQLLIASDKGRLEDVRRLLDAGADVNTIDSNGYFPLMKSVSASEVNEAVVSLLLQRGANLNAINVNGETAMHFVAYYGRSGRGVILLIDAGADLDAREWHGATPLHWAAYKNNDAALRAPLAGGARKELRPWSGDWRGKTPLDMTTSDTIRNLLRP